MASQNDMFLDDPQIDNGQRSATCPNSLSYGFVILFNWNESIKTPFKMFPRKAFSIDEISNKCMNSNLKDEFRIKKLKALKPLPGQKMSLFAKVESCKLVMNNQILCSI